MTTDRIDIRLKPELKSYIRSEARRSGMTLTEFLLESVECYRKTKEQQQQQRSITANDV